MTFGEIVASEKDFLTPADVADVLKCTPYTINLQAQEDSNKLGFPVCLTGRTVRIPRLGFVHWMKYGNAPVCEE